VSVVVVEFCSPHASSFPPDNMHEKEKEEDEKEEVVRKEEKRKEKKIVCQGRKC
jgi:hypothetical protein